MTACPAGVNYAELFEHARAEAERSGVLANPKRNLIRGFTLRWLFMDLTRLHLVGRVDAALSTARASRRFIRRSGILKLMPKRLRELEAMTPQVQAEVFRRIDRSRHACTRNAPNYRVAMLTGCAQDLIFSDVNRDTVEVLARNGCEVITPPEQHCCGSLHAHNGEWELAQVLARKSIDQFPPEAVRRHHHQRGGLRLASQALRAPAGTTIPRYAKRAELWDEKVKDIHEWLAQIGIEAPQDRMAPRH